jgi:hypothetical protein
MSSPFTTPFTCKGCGTEAMEIDKFPGDLCPPCGQAAYDAKVAVEGPPTAAEIVALWGGPVRRSR